MSDGTGYAVEDLLEFGLEETLEVVAALNADAEGALAEVFHDEGGGGCAEVCGEEDGLQADEGGLVDFAGERDDGADGLGEGLAGAGDRLLHAVEEAAFWFLRLLTAATMVGWSGCCSGLSRLPKREKAML